MRGRFKRCLYKLLLCDLVYTTILIADLVLSYDLRGTVLSAGPGSIPCKTEGDRIDDIAS